MSFLARRSSRATKPLGYYKNMANGKDNVALGGQLDLANASGNSGNESSSEDEELNELRREEKELEAHKNTLRTRKSERKEKEKQMLRERIAALKKETSALQAQLACDSGDDEANQSSSRSLPDSSEYQKLLQDLTRMPSKGKKSSKRCKEGSTQSHNKSLIAEIKKVFTDKKGTAKLPSAKDLKKLAYFTEASESSDSRNTHKSKSAQATTSEDSSSDSPVGSSSSDGTDSAQSPANKPKKAKKKKKGKLVSGRVEKVDETDIIKVVKYPHSKLSSDFVRVKKFDALPFHHLVAGEIEIISRTSCGEKERQARLGILKYLAYHFAYLDTAELREQYDAIMKRVERGELGWDNNLPKRIHRSLAFRRESVLTERQVTDASTRSGETKSKKGRIEKSEKAKKEGEDEVIYCADFNRGKCEFSTSHLGKWSGREVMKLHICKKCLTEDGLKKAHPEGDDKCPKKA